MMTGLVSSRLALRLAGLRVHRRPSFCSSGKTRRVATRGTRNEALNRLLVLMKARRQRQPAQQNQ